MLNRIKSEPALVAGFVQAALALVVAFGLDLSTEQIGAVMAVTAAALALFVRGKVSPLADDAERDEAGVSDLGLVVVVLVVLVVLILAGRL